MLLSVFILSLNAQNIGNKTFVITIATLEKFKGDYENFKTLNKYGNIFHKTYSNGITKVFLQKLDKSNFLNKEEVMKVLKVIKKDRKFRSAFIYELETANSFYSPNLQVKDQELVISVKLNPNMSDVELKSKAVEDKNPTPYVTTASKYWIQIGCFKETKTKKELITEYELTRKDEIRSQKSEDCNKYFLGVFNSLDDAMLRLKALTKCEGCSILAERWDSEMKKMVMVKNL